MRRCTLWVVLALLVASCGPSDLESQLAEQAQRIEELEAQLAEATATTSTTAVATTTTAPPTTTTVGPVDVTVNLDLVGHQNWHEGDNGCEGTGGYSDITALTQMVLEDEAGRRLAATELGPGKAWEAGALGTSYDESFCKFSFTFQSVPIDRSNYTVVSGRRGSITFERGEFLYGFPGMQLGS